MLRNLSRELKLDFEWSFRPIVLFLRCLGVDLSPSEGKTRVRRWLTHFYALFCLILARSISIFWHFLGPIDSAVTAANDYLKLFRFTTAYSSTVFFIHLIAHVGNHLILLLFIRKRFPALMKIFCQLQNELSNQRVFIKIRRFTICCITFSLFLVLHSQIFLNTFFFKYFCTVLIINYSA